MKVTAVLLSWMRPYNILPIVRSLEQHDFIHEVIIWNNAVQATELVSIESEKFPVCVISHGQNICTYGRFKAAQRAQWNVIYTQDDDILVNNIPALYESFWAHIAVGGNPITAGLSHNHYILEAHKQPWLLLGWGSFFLKGWVAILDEWIEKYGEDELLRRKADRIFTILHGEHNPQLGDYTPLRGPNGVDSERDNNSLWLRRDHRQLTMLATERALRIRQEKVIDFAGAEQ